MSTPPASAPRDDPPRYQRFSLPPVLLVVTMVAVAVRWSQLPTAMALGDTLGPWLVAWRGPLSTAPHAPPYGWMLALPHAAILPFASSLYEAFAGIRVVDALVAPLGAWTAWRTTHRAGGALAVGLLLAMDPSLQDTANSGAEAYQAPVALALLSLATTIRSRAGGWLAGSAFCWAVMCHPLALCAAPLLLCVRWSPVSLGLTGMVLLPHLWRLAAHAPSGAGGPFALPVGAFTAWASQSGRASVIFLIALLLGLRHRATRHQTAATLTSLVLLMGAGTHLGYLRDHHVRIWSAPAALGLATVPGPLGWLALAATVSPPEQPERSGARRRPGTLGLLHLTTNAVQEAQQPGQPLVVDGLRTVHTPAVEPGGVWLDLLLRGVEPDHLDVHPDGQVAILLTAPRRAPELTGCTEHGLRLVQAQDTWSICLGSPGQVEDWSASLCAQRRAAGKELPRTGGAWDGLALVHPARGAASVSGWWTCPHE